MDLSPMFECEFCNRVLSLLPSPQRGPLQRCLPPESPAELIDYEFVVFGTAGRDQLFTAEGTPTMCWDRKCYKGKPMPTGVVRLGRRRHALVEIMRPGRWSRSADGDGMLVQRSEGR